MRLLATLPALVLGVGALLAGPGTAHGPADEYEAILKDLEEARARYARAYDRAQTEDEKKGLRAHRPRAENSYPRMFALADRWPRHPAAVRALLWVATRYPGEPLDANQKRALRRVQERYPDSTILWSWIEHFSASEGRAVEAFLRAVLGGSPHAPVRGRACLTLATALRTRLETVEKRRQLADLGRAVGSDPWPGVDPAALRREVEALLERGAGEFAWVDFGRLGASARAELRVLRELAPGNPAPDIAGKDLDGQPLRLSAFRGKVVVLDFSGHWCVHCRGLYPHHQALVKRLEGRPFALLGVNSDTDPAAVRADLRRAGVTWRAWADGLGGPIHRAWNVSSFPTIYVLDRRGLIRYRDLREADLDAAVDHLLAEEGAPGAAAPPAPDRDPERGMR